MSQHVGSLRSNWFSVDDPADFAAWMHYSMQFGDEDKLHVVGKSVCISSSGVVSAKPAYTLEYSENLPEEEEGDWDLTKLADEIWQRLTVPQEIRIVATCIEEGTDPHASVLIIPVEGDPIFLELYPEADILKELRGQTMRLLHGFGNR